MLELFAGEAVVSNAFHHYGSFWRTRSIDNDPKSRATDRVDFLKLKWNNIGVLPDFIWISPPCFTYSCWEEDRLANIPEAIQQDRRFTARIAWFLELAKKKKDHLIFVIENPVGWSGEAPMVKTIIGKKMELHCRTIDYCAFGGRKDTKRTNLWTNDLQLHGALSILGRCSPETCTHHGKCHPRGARASGHHEYYPDSDSNPAAIQKDLVDTVADSVSAKFSINDLKVRYKAEPEVTKEEIEMFNRVMGGG